MRSGRTQGGLGYDPQYRTWHRLPCLIDNIKHLDDGALQAYSGCGARPIHDMHADPEISVVAPCYNERDNLHPLTEAIRAALDPTKRSYEIVIVDDCS